jgi:hypothetical protein
VTDHSTPDLAPRPRTPRGPEPIPSQKKRGAHWWEHLRAPGPGLPNELPDLMTFRQYVDAPFRAAMA